MDNPCEMSRDEIFADLEDWELSQDPAAAPQEEEWELDTMEEEQTGPRPYSALKKLWCKASRKTCMPGLTQAECLGLPRDKLIRKLQDAGFYKITAVAQEDLSCRRKNLLDTVCGISIGEETEFRRKTEFPFDAPIVVRYHDFRRQAVGFTPQELRKGSVCDTKAYFLHQGFGTVKTVAIQDLKMGWLKIDGQVEKVLIDGFDCFKKDSLFPVDVEITIYYHTYRHSGR